MEEKYRSIKKSNQTFSKRLGSLQGGHDLLLASGFTIEIKDSVEYYTLPSSETAVRLSTLVKAKKEIGRLLIGISHMESLPSDTLRQIGDCLCADDVVNFSCTSKRIRKQISSYSTTPQMFLKTLQRDGNDDNFHYGFDIPTGDTSVVHSARVTLKWRDQGWGNRKGEIQILSFDSNGGGSELIYNSASAPHRFELLSIVFNVSPNKTYKLYYKQEVAGDII